MDVVMREEMGVPWKEEVFGFEEREGERVVVAMVAIEERNGLGYLSDIWNDGRRGKGYMDLYA